jgi:hypothetical protein
MAELTPFLFFLIIIFSILCLIGVLLTTVFILFIFTHLFRFKNKNFRTALYTMLAVFGIMIAVNGTLSFAFIDKIEQLRNNFTVISFLASFVSGFYLIFKFYKESLGKCIAVWLLTCVTELIFFVAFVAIITLLYPSKIVDVIVKVV